MFQSMSPRKLKQMQRAMRRAGIGMEEWEDVQEVIIRTSEKEYVIREPQVVTINVHGQKSFQITGVVEERELMVGEEVAAAEVEIPEDDVKLVAAQAGVDMETARAALRACEGNPAEAILKLMGEGE